MTNKTAHYYAHIMRSLVCIITKYIISICHSSGPVNQYAEQ